MDEDLQIDAVINSVVNLTGIRELQTTLGDLRKTLRYVGEDDSLVNNMGLEGVEDELRAISRWTDKTDEGFANLGKTIDTVGQKFAKAHMLARQSDTGARRLFKDYDEVDTDRQDQMRGIIRTIATGTLATEGNVKAQEINAAIRSSKIYETGNSQNPYGGYVLTTRPGGHGTDLQGFMFNNEGRKSRSFGVEHKLLGGGLPMSYDWSKAGRGEAKLNSSDTTPISKIISSGKYGGGLSLGFLDALGAGAQSGSLLFNPESLRRIILKKLSASDFGQDASNSSYMKALRTAVNDPNQDLDNSIYDKMYSVFDKGKTSNYTSQAAAIYKKYMEKRGKTTEDFIKDYGLSATFNPDLMNQFSADTLRVISKSKIGKNKDGKTVIQDQNFSAVLRPKEMFLEAMNSIESDPKKIGRNYENMLGAVVDTLNSRPGGKPIAAALEKQLKTLGSSQLSSPTAALAIVDKLADFRNSDEYKNASEYAKKSIDTLGNVLESSYYDKDEEGLTNEQREQIKRKRKFTDPTEIDTGNFGLAANAFDAAMHGIRGKTARQLGISSALQDLGTGLKLVLNRANQATEDVRENIEERSKTARKAAAKTLAQLEPDSESEPLGEKAKPPIAGQGLQSKRELDRMRKIAEANKQNKAKGVTAPVLALPAIAAMFPEYAAAILGLGAGATLVALGLTAVIKNWSAISSSVKKAASRIRSIAAQKYDGSILQNVTNGIKTFIGENGVQGVLNKLVSIKGIFKGRGISSAVAAAERARRNAEKVAEMMRPDPNFVPMPDYQLDPKKHPRQGKDGDRVLQGAKRVPGLDLRYEQLRESWNPMNAPAGLQEQFDKKYNALGKMYKKGKVSDLLLQDVNEPARLIKEYQDEITASIEAATDGVDEAVNPQKFKQITDIVNKLRNLLSLKLFDLSVWASETFDKIRQRLRALSADVEQFVRNLVTAFATKAKAALNNFVNFIKTLAKNIRDAFVSAFNAVKAFITGPLVNAFKSIGNAVKSFIIDAINKIKNGLLGALRAIYAYITGPLWTGLKLIFSGFVRLGKIGFGALLGGLKSLAAMLRGALPALLQALAQKAIAALTAIQNVLQKIAGPLKQLANSLGQVRNQINQVLSQASAKVGQFASTMMGAFNKVGGSLDNLGKKYEGFGKRVKNGFESAKESAATLYFLSSTMTQAGSKLTGFGNKQLQTGKQFLDQYSGYEMAANRLSVSSLAGGNAEEGFNIAQDFVFGMQSGKFKDAAGNKIFTDTYNAEQVAQSAYYYQSAAGTGADGVSLLESNPQAMAQILGPIMNMAAATQTDVQTYIKGVVNMAQQFGYDPSQAEDADVMANLANVVGQIANVTTLEVPDILETFKYIGPQLNMISGGGKGAGLGDALVMTEMASRAGIKGSMAGTGIGQIVATLVDVPEAVAESVLPMLGMGAKEGREAQEAFRGIFLDGGGKLEGGIVGALSKIIDKTSGRPEEVARVLTEIFPQNATRASSAISSQLIKASGDERFLQAIQAYDSGDFEAANRLYEEAMARTSDTVTASVGRVKNAFFQLKVTMFDAVKNPLKEYLNTLANVFFQLADAIENNPFLSKLVSGISSVIAIVATVLGSLLTFGGTLFMIQRSFIMAGGSISLFLGIITTLISGLFTMVPILLIIGIAVTALIGHFKKSGESIQEFVARLKGDFGDDLGRRIFALSESIKNGLTLAAKAFYEFVNVLGLGKGATAALANDLTAGERVFLSYRSNLEGLTNNLANLTFLGTFLDNLFGPKTAAALVGILDYASGSFQNFGDTVGQESDSIVERVKKLKNVGSVIEGLVQAFAFEGPMDSGIADKIDIFGSALGITDLSATIEEAGNAIWDVIGVIVGYARYFRDEFSLVFDEIRNNLTKFNEAESQISVLAVALGFLRGIIVGLVTPFLMAANAVAALTRWLSTMRSESSGTSQFLTQLTGMKVGIEQLGKVAGLVFGAMLGAKILMSLKPIGQMVVGVSKLGVVLAKVGTVVGKIAIQFALLTISVAQTTASLIIQASAWVLSNTVSLISSSIGYAIAAIQAIIAASSAKNAAAKTAETAATAANSAAAVVNTAATAANAAASTASATAQTTETAAKQAETKATVRQTLEKIKATLATNLESAATIGLAGAKALALAAVMALAAGYMILVLSLFVLAGILVVALGYMFGWGAAIDGVKILVYSFIEVVMGLVDTAKDIIAWGLSFAGVSQGAGSMMQTLGEIGRVLGYLIGIPVLAAFSALVAVFAALAAAARAALPHINKFITEFGPKIKAGISTAIPQIINTFKTLIPVITGIVQAVGSSLVSNFMIFASILGVVFSAISKLSNSLKDNQAGLSRTGKIIGTLIGFLISFKAALMLTAVIAPIMKVASLFSGPLSLALKGVTFLVTKLTTVMLANPWILAIMAIIAVIYLLWDKWDGIFNAIWRIAVEVAEFIAEAFINSIGLIVYVWEKSFGQMWEAVLWGLEKIIGAAAGIAGFFGLDGLQDKLEGAQGVISDMKATLGTVGEGLMNYQVEWEADRLAPEPPKVEDPTAAPTAAEQQNAQGIGTFAGGQDGFVLDQNKYTNETTKPQIIYTAVTDEEGNVTGYEQTEYYRYRGETVKATDRGYTTVDEAGNVTDESEVVYGATAVERYRQRREDAAARVEENKQPSGLFKMASDWIQENVMSSDVVQGLMGSIGIDAANMDQAQLASTVLMPEDIAAMRQATVGTVYEEDLDSVYDWAEKQATKAEELTYRKMQLEDKIEKGYADDPLGFAEAVKELEIVNKELEKTQVTASLIAEMQAKATAETEKRVEFMTKAIDAMKTAELPSFENWVEGAIATTQFGVNTVFQMMLQTPPKIDEFKPFAYYTGKNRGRTATGEITGDVGTREFTQEDLFMMGMPQAPAGVNQADWYMNSPEAAAWRDAITLQGGNPADFITSTYGANVYGANQGAWQTVKGAIAAGSTLQQQSFANASGVDWQQYSSFLAVNGRNASAFGTGDDNLTLTDYYMEDQGYTYEELFGEDGYAETVVSDWIATLPEVDRQAMHDQFFGDGIITQEELDGLFPDSASVEASGAYELLYDSAGNVIGASEAFLSNLPPVIETGMGKAIMVTQEQFDEMSAAQKAYFAQQGVDIITATQGTVDLYAGQGAAIGAAYAQELETQFADIDMDGTIDAYIIDPVTGKRIELDIELMYDVSVGDDGILDPQEYLMGVLGWDQAQIDAEVKKAGIDRADYYTGEGSTGKFDQAAYDAAVTEALRPVADIFGFDQFVKDYEGLQAKNLENATEVGKAQGAAVVEAVTTADYDPIGTTIAESFARGIAGIRFDVTTGTFQYRLDPVDASVGANSGGGGPALSAITPESEYAAAQTGWMSGIPIKGADGVVRINGQEIPASLSTQFVFATKDDNIQFDANGRITMINGKPISESQHVILSVGSNAYAWDPDSRTFEGGGVSVSLPPASLGTAVSFDISGLTRLNELGDGPMGSLVLDLGIPETASVGLDITGGTGYRFGQGLIDEATGRTLVAAGATTVVSAIPDPNQPDLFDSTITIEGTVDFTNMNQDALDFMDFLQQFFLGTKGEGGYINFHMSFGYLEAGSKAKTAYDSIISLVSLADGNNTISFVMEVTLGDDATAAASFLENIMSFNPVQSNSKTSPYRLDFYFGLDYGTNSGMEGDTSTSTMEASITEVENLAERLVEAANKVNNTKIVVSVDVPTGVDFTNFISFMESLGKIAEDLDGGDSSGVMGEAGASLEDDLQELASFTTALETLIPVFAQLDGLSVPAGSFAGIVELLKAFGPDTTTIDKTAPILNISAEQVTVISDLANAAYNFASAMQMLDLIQNPDVTSFIEDLDSMVTSLAALGIPTGGSIRIDIQSNVASIAAWFVSLLASLNRLANMPDININVNMTGGDRPELAGGINNPKDGTGNAASGGIISTPFTLVGELGRELVSLPMGSRVFTASQTENMLTEAFKPSVNMMAATVEMPNSIQMETDSRSSQSSGGDTIVVNFNGDMNIRDQRDIELLVDEIDRELGRRTQNAKRGMAGTTRSVSVD